MVSEVRREWEKELKVAYMNDDGLMSVRQELEEQLKERKPDIMGLAKT